MCEASSHTRRVKVLPRDTGTHALPRPTTQSCQARSWVGRGSNVTNAFCPICILWQPLAGIEPRPIGPKSDALTTRPPRHHVHVHVASEIVSNANTNTE